MKTLRQKSICVILIFTILMTVFMPITSYARTRTIDPVNSNNSLNMSIDSNGILTWDSVSGATGYEVMVTRPNISSLYSENVADTAFALISSIDQHKYDSGQYTVVVKLKGVSGEKSMQFYYTSNVDQLESPNNLRWDGDTAKWDAVDGASIYNVALYNFDGRVTLQSTSYTSFDFSGFSPEEGWTFRVQAKPTASGTLSAKRDSSFTESPKKGNWTRTIDPVDSNNSLNMSIDSNGILTWDSVSGATGYEVMVTRPNISSLYSENVADTAFALISSIDQHKYDSGQYTVVVKLKGVSGEKSMQFYYTSNVDQLESPNNLRWDGDTAKWDAVDGASIYNVALYNFDGRVTLQSTSYTSFDFSGFSPEEGWTFRVQAKPTASGTLSAKRDSSFVESPAKETIVQITQINEASATVVAPVGGEHPSFSAVSGNPEAYSAEVTAWYGPLGALNAESVFETGREYTVRVHFTANAGYEIVNLADFTINGTLSVSTFDNYLQKGMDFTATAPATHTVIFNLNGGTMVGDNPSTVNDGDTISEPTPTKDGYIFGGWFTEDTFVNEFDFNTPITTDVQLYAKWEEIHTHSLTLVPATDAICSATGNDAYYTCSGCDMVFTDALGTVETTVEAQTIAINPDAHDWDTGIVTTPATCTAEGVKTYTCKNDSSHTKTEPITKLDHTIVPVSAVAPTCDDDGSIAHYKCSDCGKLFADSTGAVEITSSDIVDAKLGHDWGAWVVTTPATESTEGVETRTCKNDSSHTETRAIPVIGHSHTLVKTDEVPATCSAEGTKAYWTCSACHKMFSDSEGTTEITAPETIEKIAHTWDAGTVTTPASCSAEGVKTYTCTVCSETKTETIAKTSHNLTTITAVAPTCDTDGTIAHYKCSDCGKLFADSTGTVEITDIVDPKTGHDWNDWVETTPATVDTDGEKTRTCKNDSSHTETQAIPKLDLEIVEGDESSYTLESGTDITVKCNGTFTNFKELQLDGTKIDSSNYTVVSGSTVATLKASYLDTLSEGNHTLTFVYNDGRTADATLKIAKATTTNNEENNNNTETNTNEGTTNNDTTTTTEQGTTSNKTSSSPKTGDSIMLWISLLLVSVLGTVGTVKFIKKRD